MCIYSYFKVGNFSTCVDSDIVTLFLLVFVLLNLGFGP